MPAPTIDATATRNHIRHLMDHGHTATSISRTAGTSLSTIFHLLNGQQNVTRGIADAILNVTTDTAPKRVIRDCQCPNANHQHGTNTAYVTDKCRCADCTRAMRLYTKNKTLLTTREGPRLVDATDARNHLRHLIDAVGLTPGGIATATGLNRNTILALYNGQPTVQRDTNNRVMAVTLDDMNPNSQVSARGTIRRVQALHHLGYGVEYIEKATGVWVHHCMAEANRIALFGYRAVAEFYDKHAWAGPRVARTDKERAAVCVAQQKAARGGWAPAAAWDDIDLDRRPKGIERETAA